MRNLINNREFLNLNSYEKDNHSSFMSLNPFSAGRTDDRPWKLWFHTFNPVHFRSLWVWLRQNEFSWGQMWLSLLTKNSCDNFEKFPIPQMIRIRVLRNGPRGPDYLLRWKTLIVNMSHIWPLWFLKSAGFEKTIHVSNLHVSNLIFSRWINSDFQK